MRKIVLFLCVFVIGSLGFAADFSVFNLKNGQTVAIEEVHSNPIVTIDTWVRTGSINETEQNSGISHFLEHLFFKGTQKHPYGEFDKILESKGAVNNAATSKDFTHYYITIPSEHFELALEMHADMLQNPAIPQQEMDKERLVVLEEIAKDLNNPQNIVYNNLMEMMYINHPYKKRVIGSAEVVKNVSRDEILEYFRKFYAPSNMVTIIVGDVDTKKALESVKNNFSSDYRKTVLPKYAKEKPLPSLLRKEVKSETTSGYMLIGYRGVSVTDKDMYALDVLSTILGDGKTSILYKSIKDRKQLAFSIGASHSTAKDDGIFYITASFVPDKYKELEKAIFDEISDLRQKGVTSEQVKLAQNIIERDTFYARESVSNIAQEIGYTFVTAGDVNFYKDYLLKIRRVTVSDVNRVLRKYLGDNNAAISVLLPNNYEEKENVVKCPQEITSTLVSENSETKKYKLSNGATVLITPNTANDIIAVTVLAKGGEFVEKTTGTAMLTADLMLKGTKKYTADEFAAVLEDNGIKITPSSSADWFLVRVLTTKNQLDKTLELLDEVLNNAIFDENELKKLKAEKINAIKKNRDIALKRAVEEYNTLIYQGSVYSNSTKILEKAYPKVSRKDIVDYYNKILEPQNLVISVNGNVDTEKFLKSFEAILKRPQGTKSEYSVNIPVIKTPRISKQIDKQTQTDWVLLGWQTAGYDNPREAIILTVIDSLLGEGMSSRLFINLREKEGLAYQLGSSYISNFHRGNFVTFIGTNPKTLDRSIQKLFIEINRLKNEPVSEGELQAAKDKLLGQYILSLETNLAKSLQVGIFEASGRGYDFKQKYIETIKAVTPEDIKAIANKYFNDNYVLSVVKK